MRISGFAPTLTVDDVAAATDFYVSHFGFTATVTTEFFAKVAHPDHPFELCFLKRGSEVLPEGLRDQRAGGIIIAFVVADATREEARLRQAGLMITMPLRDEPWGERLFQVQDPNGITVQLVEWVSAANA